MAPCRFVLVVPVMVLMVLLLAVTTTGPAERASSFAGHPPVLVARRSLDLTGW